MNINRKLKILFLITLHIFLIDTHQPTQQTATSEFQIMNNSILSKQSNNQAITTRLLPSTNCNAPCLTCSSFDPDSCNSCIDNRYWYDWFHDSCNLCSNSITDCLTCQTSMGGLSCTACFDNTHYLYRGSCIACSISMTNCVTCTSSSVCLSCIDNNYYVDLDNKCHLCSQQIAFCLQCESYPGVLNFNCTACISVAYFLTSSGVCESCWEDMPFCINCTNSSYCLNCVNNSYSFQLEENSCILCSVSFQNCSTCTERQCTRCQEGYVLFNGTCVCPIGKLVKGICTTIVGCIDPVNYPDGTSGCLACNSTDFNSTPADNFCNCLEGNLIGELCVDIIGCVAAQTDSSGTPYCLFCNTIAKFQKQPNSNGLCQCSPHTQISKNICVDICGDGYLMDNLHECDDGNYIDGDGCSSVCKIQTGYRCQNGSTTNPSECTFIGNLLNLKLTSVQKTEDQNQGIFIFTLSPSILNFGKMDLMQLVSLHCQSQYTVPTITYNSGQLKIVADYSQNMENKYCQLSVSFDKKYIISPKVTLKFQAVGRNYPLIISEISNIKMIKFAFKILSLIILGLFVLSLPHKMIGPELLVCCQIAYISSCLYDSPSLFNLTIKSFGMVTGGWSYFESSQYQTLFPHFTDRVSIYPYFLQNSIFILSILLLSTAVWIFFILYITITKKQKRILEQHHTRKDTKAEKTAKIVYYMLLYPTSAGFFISLSLSAYVNNFRLDTAPERYFKQPLSSLAQLAAWLIIGIVFWIEFTDLKSENGTRLKFSGLQNVKHWYIPLFLVRSIAILTLYQVGIYLSSFHTIIYVVLGIMFLYLLLIAFGQPYQRNICNITLLIQESTSIISILLAIFSNHIAMNETVQKILIYTLLSFICLVIAFSLYRVALLYCTVVSNCLSNKNELLCQKLLPQVAKNQFQSQLQKQRKRQNPYSIFTPEDQRKVRTLSEVNQVQQQLSNNRSQLIMPFQNAINSIILAKQTEDQNEQLKTIKNRLRDDLRRKKLGLKEIQLQ